MAYSRVVVKCFGQHLINQIRRFFSTAKHQIQLYLIGKLRHADHELATRKTPTSLVAYDCVVLGLNHFYKWTPDDNKKALELFTQAISIDPEYACAYAWLAQAYFREGLNMWSASYEHRFSLLYDYAVKAVTLDDNDSLTHTALGIAYLFRREHDLARSHFERALTLNPSNTDAMVHLARWEALTGNPDKGIERLTEALQYNPLANYQWFVGQIDFIAERYDDALKSADAAVQIYPDRPVYREIYKTILDVSESQ